MRLKIGPRSGRKSAVLPNGDASRGRRKGSGGAAKFPQPSEGICDANKRSETGAGRSAARRGGLATDLSQLASAAKPTVPLPEYFYQGRRKESTNSVDLLAGDIIVSLRIRGGETRPRAQNEGGAYSTPPFGDALRYHPAMNLPLTSLLMMRGWALTLISRKMLP